MERYSVYVFDIRYKNHYDNIWKWIVMSDIENRVNLSSYKKEVKDVLKRLVKTMPAYKELRFFVECFINHYLPDLEKDSSDIVVIGSNIPEELVLVSGKMPYWILGGSRVSSMWADNMLSLIHI